MAEVNIQVPTNSGLISGRNGVFGITAVQLSGFTDDKIWPDGVGRRGATIRGGLRLDPEAMDSLASQWLEYRGWALLSPEELKAQNPGAEDES